MSVNIQLKRSNAANKRPNPAALAFGEVALNYSATSSGLFFAADNGSLVKVGPAAVSATAPNATPAGFAGNSVGEFWYDTATSSLKIWDGSVWQTTGGGGGGGTVLSVTGNSPITVNNLDPANPVINIDAASTTASGAVQLYDNVDSTSASFAATANAVKTAYDAAVTAQTTADAALPKAGGTMTGDITFNVGQVFPGTVTSVTATGPISSSGGSTPDISIAPASTTGSGAVQLEDSVTSTSTTLALTANQGYLLQQQIDSLVVSGLTLAGTYDANAGLVVSVTTAGTSAGFSTGNPLPAPAAGNDNYFVIVEVAGSNGPNAALATVGDWFLSDGSVWVFLNVGYDVTAATTAVAGIVRLSTDLETQTGTDATIAVTPASLQSKISDSVSTTSSTTIASSTAVKTAYDLANAAVPDSAFDAVGDLLVGSGPDTYGNLPVGADGTFLIADSGAALGLSYTNAVDGGTF